MFLGGEKVFLGEFHLCTRFRKNKSLDNTKNNVCIDHPPTLEGRNQSEETILAGPQGRELSRLSARSGPATSETAGKFTPPPLCLSFSLSSEEAVLTTEIRWKQ